MSLNLPRSMTNGLTSASLTALLLLGSCGAPPAPERPAAPSSELNFDAGVDYAIDDLLVQTQRLPAFSAAPSLLKADAPRGVIAVDPAIDGNTGQQTVASKALDSRLLQRASNKFAQFDVAAVNSTTLGKAQYLLAATLTPIDAAKGTSTFRISLSLTDIKTGFVVAQSAARIRNEGVDTTPTPFYRDSPSLTKDRVVEGQIKTAQTPTGGAADEIYMSRLPINALISEGSDRYEAGNYAEALRYYESAAARPEGQQLRVLNGLYLGSGRQHIDNSTVIEHVKPRASSFELYKGILNGAAHGVFNGKIVVHKDAQKSDARQVNKNLLLSDDAVVNTKPQLEIHADDVKCSHGSTIGQIDPDALFYFRSRGLGLAEARRLLSSAFAADVVARIKVASLRQRLDEYLLEKFREI